MTCHSAQPRDCKCVKCYGFLSFGKTCIEIFLKKIKTKKKGKNLSCKYSQKLLDHVKQPATDALKITSKRTTQKREKSRSSR